MTDTLLLTTELPASPEAFRDAAWADVLPYYDTLATAPLEPTSANVEPWLATWSRLDTLVGEAGTLAMIAYTGDTADAAREQAYLRFSMDIFPKLEEQQVRLARRLLDLGWTRADLETTLRRFRTDIEIFREANVERFSRIEELSAGYQKLVGGLSVDWDGQAKTIPQLQPYLKDTDRAVRERAFRLGAQAYLDRRDELAECFDRMYALRIAVAKEAGFADYQQYCFAAKHRFDYSPQDTARFHDAVRETVTPAVAKLMEYRRRSLGVDALRPWDVSVDLDIKEPLKPFATVDVFVDRARKIFSRVDAELGDQFALMAKESLLDLESRPGKAPGGYCTDLSFRGRPFIFMNAVGVPDDVNTLVHEAGHCFHDFATHALPYTWMRKTGHEAAELASMSMELLAMPYLVQPDGYYTRDEARIAWLEHLEDVLGALVHIASVDAFQAWIYTDPAGADRDARDAKWLQIRAEFEQGVNWDGLEQERTARWYRQLHIFELPFYYIEYGIAQLGALQVFRNAVQDAGNAVTMYKQFLALGGTRTLPELYAAAGAKLVFDAATMKELVEFTMERIDALRAGADAPFTGIIPR
ncbi:MAG: M3 family oligoendopeptidase [Gemmatimonas sp.]|jgi:oligoendopeptidase F|uniref:M3 family oligoendopeptidase n=1 Tax=Gemmatimonas sp. TaxID=1962908 RepID=UPI0031C8B9DC|nr:M3 family oligoendopeptidase [Gemmatimonas sp.]